MSRLCLRRCERLLLVLLLGLRLLAGGGVGLGVRWTRPTMAASIGGLMPRQSLLVSRGPAGAKGLPTDRRAGNKRDGVRDVISNRAPQTLRRSRRTHRQFRRAGKTCPPKSGHRGGRCTGWTAVTVCPCSWLRTLHVKAAAWTRTGNTGRLREEKEHVRHRKLLLSYPTLRVEAQSWGHFGRDLLQSSAAFTQALHQFDFNLERLYVPDWLIYQESRMQFCTKAALRGKIPLKKYALSLPRWFFAGNAKAALTPSGMPSKPTEISRG